MLGKYNHYYCNQIGSPVFAIEWHHSKCVCHDFDLQFHGHKFGNVIISKTVRASEKCSSMTFIDVDICHLME